MSDDRHIALMQALQTGVATDQSLGSQDGSPKHLRVGVNSLHCGMAAIAKLLIAKGIITSEEYEKAINDELELEVQRYEADLSRKLGRKVVLR